MNKSPGNTSQPQLRLQKRHVLLLCILTLIAIPQSSLAIGKLIECRTDINKTIDKLRDNIKIEKMECETGNSHACTRLGLTINNLEKCKSVSINFGQKNTFIFDETALTGNTKSNADYYSESCHNSRSETKSIEISSTPTTIIFDIPIGPAKTIVQFKIDRETLKAGFGPNPSHECTVSDARIKNKI